MNGEWELWGFESREAYELHKAEDAAFWATMPFDRETWAALQREANANRYGFDDTKPVKDDLSGRLAPFVGQALRRAYQNGKREAWDEMRATEEQRRTALAAAQAVLAGSGAPAMDVVSHADELAQWIAKGPRP